MVKKLDFKRLQDESDLVLLEVSEMKSVGLSFRELANLWSVVLLFYLGHTRVACFLVIVFIIGLIMVAMNTSLIVEAKKVLKLRGYR